MRAVALGLALLFLGVATAAYAVLAPQQEARVLVTGARDTLDADRWTRLAVRVENPGPRPFSPAFSVPGNELMNAYAWPIESGPETLAPGESGEYVLTQPPWTGAVVGQGFRVLANDAHGRPARGASDVAVFPAPAIRPSVINPAFASWIPSMIAPFDLPYGWVPETVLHGGDTFEVAGQDGEARLLLRPDASRTRAEGGPEDWSLVALRQRIDFPATFRVDFGEGTRSDFAAGPRTVVGVSLEDVYGSTEVVVLFADAPTAPDQLPEGLLDFGRAQSQRVLVTNRSITLDMVALYEENGWRVPARQRVVQEATLGPQSVGMGALLPSAYGKLALMRPVELRVLVASFPPHQHDVVEASFAYVGGPALDPYEER